MNPKRRTLRFERFDEVMPDVERLLDGHTTVGNGTLAQICRHLAAILRRHVDLPASTAFDPADRVPEGQKRRILDSGTLSEGIDAPPGAEPREAGGDREAAEALRVAIASYLASPGPAIPHRLLGPLTREEWDRFELIHLAHHLSFAVPTATEEGSPP